MILRIPLPSISKGSPKVAFFGIIFVILTLFFCLTTKAQNLDERSSESNLVAEKNKVSQAAIPTFELGWQVGMMTNFKQLSGFTTGLYSDFSLTDKWRLQAELLLCTYTQKDFYSSQIDVQHGSYLDSLNREVTTKSLYYFAFPLLAKYRLHNNLHILAGTHIAFLVNTKSEVKDFQHHSNPFFDDHTTQRQQLAYFNGLNVFDFGITLSTDIKLGKKARLDIRYNYMLTDITQNDFYGENSRHQNSNLQATLGYNLLQLSRLPVPKNILAQNALTDSTFTLKQTRQHAVKIGVIAGINNLKPNDYVAGIVVDYDDIVRVGLKYTIQSADNLQVMNDKAHYQNGSLAFLQEEIEEFEELHYLEIPLLLQHRFGQRLKVLIGPQISILTNSKSTIFKYVNGESRASYETFGTAIATMPSADIGLSVGAGFDLLPSLSLNAQLTQGFVPLKAATDRAYYNQSLQLTLVYQPFRFFEHRN